MSYDVVSEATKIANSALTKDEQIEEINDEIKGCEDAIAHSKSSIAMLKDMIRSHDLAITLHEEQILILKKRKKGLEK